MDSIPHSTNRSASFVTVPPSVTSDPIAAPVSQIVWDVTKYTDMIMIGTDVTTAGVSGRDIQLSTDGGATYATTSGNYVSVALDGITVAQTGVPLISVASTLGRSFVAEMSGMRNTGIKKMERGDVPVLFVSSQSPITHVRVNCGSNLTGGTIKLMAR